MLSKVLRERAAVGLAVFLLLLCGVAAWVLIAGGALPAGREAKGALASPITPSANLKPTGYPQLVSVDPLPASEGEMCQWVPASASRVSLFQRVQVATNPSATSADAANPAEMDRAPLWQLRDTYPTYSAVAVDVQTGEVYLQDENLYGYKVFNRLDNTPPTVGFTEPKRVVQGMLTKMEYNCAMYIDPNNGDVYSVNNDMVDTMVVFPRAAQGNTSPQRELHTPHRTYGIAVDETNREIYLTVQNPAEVVVYKKEAAGEEKPVRILRGDQTQLADPHGIAVDLKNQLMFVSNHGSVSQEGISGSGKFVAPSIVVHQLKASGNAPALRTIEGPDTRLNWPAALFADPERGELYVANDADDSILVFRATDNGNAAPARMIKGAKTGLKNPTGIFVDPKNGEVWVSNMGNHTATVYARTANGDSAPLRTIRSAPLGKPALAIGNPGGVAYDDKRDQLLVPN
jgi:DNA-binding beta-propeller fold protein YncE